MQLFDDEHSDKNDEPSYPPWHRDMHPVRFYQHKQVLFQRRHDRAINDHDTIVRNQSGYGQGGEGQGGEKVYGMGFGWAIFFSRHFFLALPNKQAW